jgi:hypothetical protein
MNKLKEYAGLLNQAAPENHFLAYITKDEKDMLVKAGGQETATQSGILAYPPLGEAGTSPGTTTSGGSAYSGSGGNGGAGSQFTSGGNISPGTDVKGNIRNDNPYTGNNVKDDDIDSTYTDTSFDVEPTNKKTLADTIIDYIKGGGMIGAILRGVAGKLNPENKYEGITGEDGIGEGDFVYSSPNEYAQGEFGLNYKDLDLEQQAEIDQKFYDSGHRSEAFQELYRDGDTSNIENLTNQERQAIDQVIPQLSYEVGGTEPQESMVNKYFANLNNTNLGISNDFMTKYNTAKANMASILDMTPNTQQYGYGNTFASTYPRAMNSGNVFYQYLNEQGLI